MSISEEKEKRTAGSVVARLDGFQLLEQRRGESCGNQFPVGMMVRFSGAIYCAGVDSKF